MLLSGLIEDLEARVQKQDEEIAQLKDEARVIATEGVLLAVLAQREMPMIPTLMGALVMPAVRPG
jgi:hypothetical protein